ncbi:dTDP-4-dehydrorhamnose reductase [Phytohabitans suffuscus]|uniref:dTDP-4-dehydrorhamnose reductase n=1 Tax=Phytohabitans suffuscus TaxID=624315 RepID=A0A6F8YZJ9_9ACTN|nr:dTDP-4-dehydrorhamnose reductase [Phytohabitans suffuscus]BCB91423.1 NAD(P)-dependent oxidoreductase [Phytohabitans suffuscus]
MSARILVTGSGGMLGQDLLGVLKQRPDLEVTALSRADLDVTDAAAVLAAVAGHDAVLNAAAWTDVDGAEEREAEATAVNGHGAANLARAAGSAGARLVHVSTDYVFRGDATSPYPEDAPTDPVNAYGRGKLVGEEAVLGAGGYVVRTAWLYGAHGRNFVSTMLRLAGERETLDVVDDQRGQPTWSWALAERLVDLALAAGAPPGVYHGTASGETTWCGLARAVFARAGHDPERVRPTTSDRYVRPAPRPGYSVLGHGRWALAGMTPMTDWETMLSAYLGSPRA